MRQNEDIRAAAKRSGVYLWEVAERWGVSEFTLFRRLRRELEDADKDTLLDIIQQISAERGKEASR